MDMNGARCPSMTSKISSTLICCQSNDFTSSACGGLRSLESVTGEPILKVLPIAPPTCHPNIARRADASKRLTRTRRDNEHYDDVAQIKRQPADPERFNRSLIDPIVVHLPRKYR